MERPLGEHRRVGDDERICFQFCFIFLNVVPEADASDFFFALDQNFYIDGKLSVHFVERLKSFDVDVNLAFVVGGAAAKNVSVADGGFEGGRGPEV